MAMFDDKLLAKQTKNLRDKEEENLIQFEAQKNGIRYVDLTGVSISTDALALISEDVAMKNDVACFKIFDKELHVAVHAPNNKDTQAVIQGLEKQGYSVILYMVSMVSLRKAWSRYDDLTLTKRASSSLDITQDSVESIASQVKKNEDIVVLFQKAQELETNRVSRIIEIVLASAIATDSSDVHIEPQEDRVRLRFRQDGVLIDIAFFEKSLYKLMTSRLKILSKMKLTNENKAQDGRFTIFYKGAEIEVRASTIPSAYGEGFVMRILNPKGIQVSFEDLGIEKNLLAILKREIAKPNGMILTTGPTGSGKTTTLYSFLRYIYNTEINILTIEDPIEYHLTGINQTQVEHEKGYDFLAGLRAALRQDPDVIMVGEIRDSETAGIAVNASLTGHIVFSTLHTNNAAGVIPRLLDLGVNPGVLAAALSVSIAQRLARKLCVKCKKEVAINEADKLLIERVLSQGRKNNKPIDTYISTTNPEKYFVKVGCEFCNNTGYKGRVGIYEAIIMSHEVEEIIEKHPNERDIRKVAENQGIFTMAEDGIIKVLLGTTSLEEVMSVINIEDYLESTELSLTQKTPTTTQTFSSETNPKKVELELLIQGFEDLKNSLNTNTNPEDTTEKLKKLNTTFENLLSLYKVSELFKQKHNDINLVTEVDLVKQKINSLISQQTKNPSVSIQDELVDLKNILEHIRLS